jgi:hypothetical protein
MDTKGDNMDAKAKDTFEMGGDVDGSYGVDDKIASLPRFAPPAPPAPAPEAAAPVEQPVAQAAEGDVVASQAPDGDGTVGTAAGEPQVEVKAVSGEQAPADDKQPEQSANVEPDVEAKDEPAGNKASEAEKAPDPVLNMDVLRSVIDSVLTERGNTGAQTQSPLTDAELARMQERLNIHGGIRPEQLMGTPGAPGVQGVSQMAPGAAAVPLTSGQRAQVHGTGALAEGAAAALGGAMSLVGAIGRGVGHVATELASMASGKEADKVEGAAAELPSVLPRLSDYRVAQVERAAQAFASEQEKFWSATPKLSAVRGEMEKAARERGVPMEHVVEQMKPGGDLSDLRTKFNEAVAEHPEFGARKKAMDKALESYIRQYGRAQEEVLNPEQEGNPRYDALKTRLQRAHEGMEKKASELPGFANDKGDVEPSHFEKLKEAVAKIMEKIKEVMQDFIAVLRGKQGSDHAPAP